MTDRFIQIADGVELEVTMDCGSWEYTAVLRDGGKWFGEVGHADTAEAAIDDLFTETNKALYAKLGSVDDGDKSPATVKILQEIKDLRKAQRCFMVLVERGVAA